MAVASPSAKYLQPTVVPIRSPVLASASEALQISCVHPGASKFSDGLKIPVRIVVQLSSGMQQQPFTLMFLTLQCIRIYAERMRVSNLHRARNWWTHIDKTEATDRTTDRRDPPTHTS